MLLLAFLKVFFFGVHTAFWVFGSLHFKKSPFSKCVFESIRFRSGAVWTQGENGYFSFRFDLNTEQCERGLSASPVESKLSLNEVVML